MVRALAMAGGLIALGMGGAAAMAAEYCVSCTGPEASYRCEVGGSGADARAWLLCITELAKEGGHESCSVDRKVPQPCPGVHKVLAAPEGPAPDVSVPVHTATPIAPPPAGIKPPSGFPPAQANLPAAQTEPGAPAEALPDGAPSPPKRVPQTMEELAGDTYQASKQGLKKAGDTVASTAQKAGDAVTGTAKAAGDGLSKAGQSVGDAAKKSWKCLTSLFSDC